ncbi:dihydrolipoyl dehydrogenase [Negadavirga shengliensis]|uniref:Dihydrolipoyl dehydrogenase n=1 Tax=Negadavirga shengliensis TaxID=1389218 RepID=A0ABV9T8B2_9BACT
MAGKDVKEVVVLGAGPGGYAAAFRAADLGLKVTLIDPEANPGGVCLYRGCIPSKALLHLAEIKQTSAKAAEWGLAFKDPDVDAKKINRWKNKVIAKLTRGLGQLAKSRDIEYLRGRAKFTSKNKLEVDEDAGGKLTLEFKHAIIATGSVAMTLPNVEIDHHVVMDAADALELKEIPGSLLVIGGGYIGLELGSVYASFGCKVSIVEMTADFLPGTDDDLIKGFEKANKGLFEAVYFETQVEAVNAEKGKATVKLKTGGKIKEKKFDKILVAVGRQPNSASLDLDKINPEMDEKGFLKVDVRQRTSIENIFAIGDITGEPLLAHKATHEGRVAAEAIAGKAGSAYDPMAIPFIVFTNPEIAWCGLTEIQAKEKDMKVKVERFPWSASGRAITLGEETGMTKLILDAETGRVLGGGAVGKHAGVLIPEICLAIEMAATAEDLALTIHPHPTLSETIMEAAELFVGSPTHLPRK